VKKKLNFYSKSILLICNLTLKQPEPTWKASAMLSSGSSNDAETEGAEEISGEITFKQWNINAPIEVYVNISNIKQGKHSLHIHAFGDISDGCKSTGPHFRHSIIGNVEAKEDGKVDVKFHTLAVNLFGLTGVLGRSIVVHEKPSGLFIIFVFDIV
jgi:Cu-Zn family superoxide dismutase